MRSTWRRRVLLWASRRLKGRNCAPGSESRPPVAMVVRAREPAHGPRSWPSGACETGALATAGFKDRSGCRPTRHPRSRF